MALPDPQLLNALLRYDPDTGKLFWRKRDESMFVDRKHSAYTSCKRWNTQNAGKEAFTIKGRVGRGVIFKKKYLAHRVIWAMQTGKWPDNEIDHINRDPTDNRWGNLREATRSQNAQNTGTRKGSRSRYIGIYWHKRDRKWVARIQADGKVTKIGRFNDEIDAAKAYDMAAKNIHGEFASLNFPGGTQ